MDSCLTSAFMLWLMCRAQTTWKPSGWLHGGGTNEHLRWTLGPMSSGLIVGRDGSEGTAAENRKLHLELLLIKTVSSILLNIKRAKILFLLQNNLTFASTVDFYLTWQTQSGSQIRRN